MNIVKLFLIIGAILVVLAPLATPALAQTTFVWDGDGAGDEWSTEQNWVGDNGPPGPGDTAVIPGGNPIHAVEISAQDAVCKVLDLGSGSSLTIIGQKLQLGDLTDPSPSDPAPVTSTVDGTIFFKKDGSDQAVMEIGQWVKFATSGTGALDASKGWGTDYEGLIQRHTYGVGIIVDDGMRVIGSLELLVSITHNSYISDGTGVFGSFRADDVMKFGDDSGGFSPELEISTTTAANARSIFEVTKGRLEFYSVTFGENAPNWLIPATTFPTPEIDVDDSPSSAYFVDVPFDISLAKGGLLDFHHDFSSNGKLTVGLTTFSGPQVRLDSGLLVDFYTPDE